MGNPSESVPRARDSGGSTKTSHNGSRDTAFRETNDVGIRHEDKISELNPRGPLPRCLRFTSPVARRRCKTHYRLPATALTGLDFPQLDSIQGFHVLICVPPLPRFRGATEPDALPG